MRAAAGLRNPHKALFKKEIIPAARGWGGAAALQRIRTVRRRHSAAAARGAGVPSRLGTHRKRPPPPIPHVVPYDVAHARIMGVMEAERPSPVVRLQRWRLHLLPAAWCSATQQAGPHSPVWSLIPGLHLRIAFHGTGTVRQGAGGPFTSARASMPLHRISKASTAQVAAPLLA
jgi:hypothetical protein